MRGTGQCLDEALGMWVQAEMGSAGVEVITFWLSKLDQPIPVRNVDGTPNSRGAVRHEVEVKIYFKGYMEKVRMDVCNLGKADVILGMLWLS